MRPAQGPRVELIRGELTPRLLEDALLGVDVVYHLAGLTAALLRTVLPSPLAENRTILPAHPGATHVAEGSR